MKTRRPLSPAQRARRAAHLRARIATLMAERNRLAFQYNLAFLGDLASILADQFPSFVISPTRRA